MFQTHAQNIAKKILTKLNVLRKHKHLGHVWDICRERGPVKHEFFRHLNKDVLFIDCRWTHRRNTSETGFSPEGHSCGLRTKTSRQTKPHRPRTSPGENLTGRIHFMWWSSGSCSNQIESQHGFSYSISWRVPAGHRWKEQNSSMEWIFQMTWVLFSLGHLQANLHMFNYSLSNCSTCCR